VIRRRSSAAAALAALILAGSSAAVAQEKAPQPKPVKPKPVKPKPVKPKQAAKAADTRGEEEPNPDEEQVRYPPSSVRLPLILGGAFVTAASYGITLACALAWDDVPGADMMLVPIAGPWIALGMSGCAEDDPDCGAILYIRGALLVLDGIAQAAGLGLVGEGLFMTTEAVEAAPKKKAARAGSWTLAPIVTPTQTGLGVLGSF
jgi:hypothetical protein